jgi:inorganic pyrophosphatase
MNKNNKLLDKKDDIFPITKYKFDDFSKDKCVSFTGSPIKHPYDEEKFILICDPLSTHTNFYEFKKADVSYIENLTSLSSESGESIHIARVWIKKGIIGLHYEPFIVGNTSDILSDLNK